MTEPPKRSKVKRTSAPASGRSIVVKRREDTAVGSRVIRRGTDSEPRKPLPKSRKTKRPSPTPPSEEFPTTPKAKVVPKVNPDRMVRVEVVKQEADRTESEMFLPEAGLVTENVSPNQMVQNVKQPKEVLGEPSFKFFCCRCGQKLKVPVSWANKNFSCVRCGHEITIPPPLIGGF